MIDEPGSFSGSDSSPSPERGPLPSQRMSLAIFVRLTASVARAPLAKTTASWAARAANLLGALTKGRPVQLGQARRYRLTESGRCVETGAHGRAADGQLHRVPAATSWRRSMSASSWAT